MKNVLHNNQSNSHKWESRRSLPSEQLTGSACRRFDMVIEGLMIGLLAFMPLALGAAQAWSEQVVVALTGSMVLCLTLKLTLCKNCQAVWSWAYLPLVLFLILVSLQLVPLPAPIVQAVSPSTAALKTELLSDLPNAPTILDSMTISFYPLATRHGLCLLLAATGVFVVVVNVYRSPGQIKRLLGIVVFIGAGVALLALAQNLWGNGKIYQLIPTWNGKACSGPFINHSHYGQFMNLSIGAAFGLLLIKLHEHFQNREVTLPAVAARLGQSNMFFVWYLSAFIIVGGATIFVSLTRGGMLSLLAAGAFTALVITSSRHLKSQTWIMAMMAVGVFVCVLYIGFEAVHERLADLGTPASYENRWEIIENSLPLTAKFALLGTGLGTFEYVYPMYDVSTNPKVAVYAENEYLQMLTETGLIGFHLLAIFAVIIGYAYYRCLKRTNPADHLSSGINHGLAVRVAAFGLGFGLLAVMIHSFSDFGQHLPANACLSAIFCGLLINISPSGITKKQTAPVAVSERIRVLRLAVLLMVAGVCAWALFETNQARRAENHWNHARQIEKTLEQKQGKKGGSTEYSRLIAQAAAAVRYQPDNIKYRYELNGYIQQMRQRDYNENKTDDYKKSVREIVADLHQARALCPTFGIVYCLIGQLEKYILDEPAGAKHIRLGYTLAPNNTTVCYAAGLLDIQEGELTASLKKFHRYLKLGGSFRDVADIFVKQLNRPECMVSLAGDDARLLISAANILRREKKYDNLSKTIHNNAVELLRKQCDQPCVSATTLALLAQTYYKQKKYDLSIEYFRRALALDYGRVQWRLLLARMLSETKQVPQAVHEARICLRLQPKMAGAKKLLADLSIMPDALAN
jgi:tetratricopeptide (TPR) repeat protein/O-antigen ligase